MKGGGRSLRPIFFFIIAGAVAVGTATAVWSDEKPKGLWVTFDVNGERFRAFVTRDDAVGYVLGFAAGREPQRPLRARIVPGGSFNEPWGWHLEPESIRFGTVSATDVGCQVGTPSALKGDRGEYCPRRARVVRAEDCRVSGPCLRIRGLYAGRSPAL
jgi:hypothetical protein